MEMTDPAGHFGYAASSVSCSVPDSKTSRNHRWLNRYCGGCVRQSRPPRPRRRTHQRLPRLGRRLALPPGRGEVPEAQLLPHPVLNDRPEPLAGGGEGRQRPGAVHLGRYQPQHPVRHVAHVPRPRRRPRLRLGLRLREPRVEDDGLRLAPLHAPRAGGSPVPSHAGPQRPHFLPALHAVAARPVLRVPSSAAAASRVRTVPRAAVLAGPAPQRPAASPASGLRHLRAVPPGESGPSNADGTCSSPPSPAPPCAAPRPGPRHSPEALVCVVGSFKSRPASTPPSGFNGGHRMWFGALVRPSWGRPRMLSTSPRPGSRGHAQPRGFLCCGEASSRPAPGESQGPENQGGGRSSAEPGRGEIESRSVAAPKRPHERPQTPSMPAVEAGSRS